jgi:SsrA-binding protein
MRHPNRDSRDYQFIDKFEAGMVLTGSDAKSLRLQPPQFAAAKVEIKDNHPELLGLLIPLYKYSQGQPVDTTATRGLLLTRREIAKLISYRHQKYMIIPIALYTKGNWWKVELGVGRKMRKYEKRQKIKDEEFKRGL